MRLCTYTVVHDTGFAPNPFGSHCTLAACTPNHQDVRLSEGDWLVGHSDRAHGRELVYAMVLTESPMGFDEYYSDPRFQHKKPRFDEGWERACGDNIYHRPDGVAWVQDPSLFHSDAGSIRQDTDHPVVYVSDRFYYFGRNALPIPDRFKPLLRDRHGAKCSHPDDLAGEFAAWVESALVPGVHGTPRDLGWTTDIDEGRTSCRRLTRAQPGPGCRDGSVGTGLRPPPPC